MPVDIHGKQYITVAERVQALHETIEDRIIKIETEFLPSNEMVVCRARVQIGECVYTGTSAANPTKAIEKQSPYEVAETSAVGRALGFAGFGIIEGIASADEIVKVLSDPRIPQDIKETEFATQNQINALNQMVKKGELTGEQVKNMPSMTKAEAHALISSVWGTK